MKINRERATLSLVSLSFFLGEPSTTSKREITRGSASSVSRWRIIWHRASTARSTTLTWTLWRYVNTVDYSRYAFRMKARKRAEPRAADVASRRHCPPGPAWCHAHLVITWWLTSRETLTTSTTMTTSDNEKKKEGDVLLEEVSSLSFSLACSLARSSHFINNIVRWLCVKPTKKKIEQLFFSRIRKIVGVCQSRRTCFSQNVENKVNVCTARISEISILYSCARWLSR